MKWRRTMARRSAAWLLSLTAMFSTFAGLGSVSVAADTVGAAASETTLAAMLSRAEAMVNYTWTPTQRISTWNKNTYNGKTYFEAGETVKGMPYTLFTSEVVGDSLLSLAQYQAVASKNYGTSAYCVSTGSTRQGPVYGSCCATFVSEIFGGNFMYGANPRYDSVNSIRNSSYGTTQSGVKASEIQAGDALSVKSRTASHIVWVGEVTATTLTLYEQTPPVARKVTLSLASSVNSDGYLVYGGEVYNTVTRSNQYNGGGSTPSVGTPNESFAPYLPIKAYPCSTENFTVYEGDRTTSGGSIYVDDYCTIDQIYEDGWCLVTYPAGSGTKQKYAPLDRFIAGYSGQDFQTPYGATAQIKVHKNVSLDGSVNWYISPGDRFYRVATQGAVSQVLYPLDAGGYKLAWVANDSLPAPVDPDPDTDPAPTTYFIQYDANGGMSAPAAQTKVQGVPLTLSSATPVREGYAFCGWSDRPAADQVVYQAGGVYTAEAAVTLYAVWMRSPTPIVRPEPPDDAAPAFVLSDAYGAPGDTVEMVLSVRNNPGFCAATLSVLYDSAALSLVGVRTAEGVSGDASMAKQVAWLGRQDWSADGAWLILTFRIEAQAQEGTLAVTAAYADGNVSNYAEEDVSFYVVPGSISVDADRHVPGDVNRDGAVNSKDLTRLKRYMAGESVEVDAKALDVNGDGAVNSKDVTRLMRYLAGDSVTVC